MLQYGQVQGYPGKGDNICFNYTYVNYSLLNPVSRVGVSVRVSVRVRGKGKD
jgi:hypothetical protein